MRRRGVALGAAKTTSRSSQSAGAAAAATTRRRSRPSMRWLDRLLVFVATLVAIISLLPLGARLAWALELTTHFRVQYLVVTAVLLLLLALRRRFGACAVLVAAGAVSAAPLLPYLPLPVGSESANAAAAPPLKILSVNVSFLQFSSRRLLEIVREA